MKERKTKQEEDKKLQDNISNLVRMSLKEGFRQGYRIGKKDKIEEDRNQEDRVCSRCKNSRHLLANGLCIRCDEMVYGRVK